MTVPPSSSLRVTQTLTGSLTLLDRPRQQARASFRAWMEEMGRARAAVEARARSAVADCYRFGLLVQEEPEAFEALCKVLGIRQTRQDRSTNPFIRVVKAVFGREVEDGTGGPPRWEWLSDSQINKYATVMNYAAHRGIAATAVEDWLSTDWNALGEAVPMSLSRRLREAREALRADEQAALLAQLPAPLPAPARDRRWLDKLGEAVDRLPASVDVTPLALKGLGAPEDAAVIVSLGDDQAIRLSGLTPDILIEVISTIARSCQRQAPASEGAGQPAFAAVVSVLRHVVPLVGSEAIVRLVNHQDWCSLLIGGSLDSPLVRAEIPPLPGVPRRRVFVLSPAAVRSLLQAYGGVAAGVACADVFQESNFSRPGGLLEQRLRLLVGDQAMVIPLQEVPAAVAAEVADARLVPLGDIGITAWDAFVPLDRADLAALARLDSRAARWKEQHRTRTGRDTIRRASRIIDLDSVAGNRLSLSLRRGGDQPVILPTAHGVLPSTGLGRIGRSALGMAAQVLLRRNATDDAALLIAHSALWLVTGLHAATGERLFLALPAVDEAGRPVGRGLRDARLEPDTEAYSALLDRAIRRLGVGTEVFPAMGTPAGSGGTKR
ncbi:hypothetical protein [Insolitispirillum peregrinum]|uniref:Uncharacterized protein n=1 Tax=Insolitispirillum peregrinum TaxID=80876 RepID=A0A1N7JGV7_9PROT|nr:hypothetical protein [Insolitispirillum peregrinum]SIS48549.1 hypothetical protein SAMN05421779_102248 [Insolitispirillum peregrinum]